MSRVKYFAVFLIIASVYLLVTLPFFHDGFFPTMDDVQVVRIEEMARELKSGQFPVRIANNLGNGGGYMLFNFYSPLVYYVGAVFNLLGFSLVKSTKLVFLLGYLTGTFGMILLLKRYTGWVATILGTTLFLTSSYLGYEVYSRGTLGEFFALCLMPAFLWSFLRLKKQFCSTKIIIAAVLFALIIVTHSFIGFVSCLLLTLLLIIPPLNIKQVRGFILAIGYGLCLSASFLLPLIFEVKSTVYSHTQFGSELYALNYLNPLQLGGITGHLSGSRYPFLGFGLFAGVIISFVLLLKKRKKILLKDVSLFALIGYLLSLFLIWQVSKPLWDNIYLLRYLQFPWRFLASATMMAVLFIGLGLETIKNQWLKIVAGILLLFPAVVFQGTYLRPTNYNFIAKYSPEDICSSTTWEQEYLPLWTKECFPKNMDKPTVESLNPLLKISDTIVSKNGRTISFVTQGLEGKITVNKYFYPGWQAKMDENTSLDISPFGKNGALGLTIPSGKHTVKVSFEDTLIRTVGNCLSLASIGFLVFWILKRGLTGFVQKLVCRNIHF